MAAYDSATDATELATRHLARSSCEHDGRRSRMRPSQRQVDTEAVRLMGELRELRIKAGLPREFIAAHFGRSVRMIERVENGDIEPRISDLNTYAAALDLPPVSRAWTVERPAAPEPVQKPREPEIRVGQLRGWAA